jgi:hypothetical protein
MILLWWTASTAASEPITAILAVGNAIVASGSKPGPPIAYSPAPYAFRTTTQILGTVASETAVIIFGCIACSVTLGPYPRALPPPTCPRLAWGHA